MQLAIEPGLPAVNPREVMTLVAGLVAAQAAMDVVGTTVVRKGSARPAIVPILRYHHAPWPSFLNSRFSAS